MNEITRQILESFKLGERRYIETTFDDSRPLVNRIGECTPAGMAFHSVPFCAVALTDNGYLSRSIMCIERVK